MACGPRHSRCGQRASRSLTHAGRCRGRTVSCSAEQRLGVFGRIAGFLGGLVWAIATFLAVPVVVAEGLGPFAAVKRSAELIRTAWGTGLRTTLRFGLIQFLLMLPMLIAAFIGVFLLVSGSTAGFAAGVVVVGVAVLALFALGAVFSAISSYAWAMICRYATGQPVPASRRRRSPARSCPGDHAGSRRPAFSRAGRPCRGGTPAAYAYLAG